MRPAGPAALFVGRNRRCSSSVQSVTTCWHVSGGSDPHTWRLVKERGGTDTLALCPLATVADHVDQSTQRTWRETKIRRRGPAICKLRVPHGDQLTRTVLNFDNHVSLATMPLAPDDPDDLSGQRMMARCHTNRFEDAGIHPLLLLTG